MEQFTPCCGMKFRFLMYSQCSGAKKFYKWLGAFTSGNCKMIARRFESAARPVHFLHIDVRKNGDCGIRRNSFGVMNAVLNHGDRSAFAAELTEPMHCERRVLSLYRQQNNVSSRRVTQEKRNRAYVEVFYSNRGRRPPDTKEDFMTGSRKMSGEIRPEVASSNNCDSRHKRKFNLPLR